MATITSKNIIDDLIEHDGYYEGDPRVYMIVEYTNYYGGTTWGVTWINENKERRNRYLVESQYIINPKVIWKSND